MEAGAASAGPESAPEPLAGADGPVPPTDGAAAPAGAADQPPAPKLELIVHSTARDARQLEVCELQAQCCPQLVQRPLLSPAAQERQAVVSTPAMGRPATQTLGSAMPQASASSQHPRRLLAGQVASSASSSRQAKGHAAGRDTARGAAPRVKPQTRCRGWKWLLALVLLALAAGFLQVSSGHGPNQPEKLLFPFVVFVAQLVDTVYAMQLYAHTTAYSHRHSLLQAAHSSHTTAGVSTPTIWRSGMCRARCRLLRLPSRWATPAPVDLTVEL